MTRPLASHSRTLRRVFVAACGLLVCGLVASAAAQSTLIIEHANIITGDGRLIKDGTLVIRGDKIAAVAGEAPRSAIPFARPRRIDATGKFVTPGLIDVWSTITTGGDSAQGQTTAVAADDFDAYAVDVLRDSLRQGVTTVYLAARDGDGTGGIGSVVRLIPRGEPDKVVLLRRAALEAALLDPAPLGRVKTAAELAKDFADAQDYREALETYDEDLKEYQKKLAEWVKKQGEKSSDGVDKEGKDDEKNAAAARRPRRGHRGQKPTEKGDKKPKDGKGTKGKNDAPTKPTKPERDPAKQVLLDVIDGQLLWRVEAYRPADMLNALDVAQRFNLALVFEGATGAARIADVLAEREIPVIVDAEPPPVRYAGGLERDRTPDALARLVRAGVPLYFGSGPGGSAATSYLALRAAAAVAAGMDEADAMKAITSGAARLLGVDDQVGRLAPGLSADVVIWSAHPLAPGARAERVFIAGREVFKLHQGKRKQKGS